MPRRGTGRKSPPAEEPKSAIYQARHRLLCEVCPFKKVHEYLDGCWARHSVLHFRPHQQRASLSFFLQV